MKWRGRRQSGNIEDRRGQAGAAMPIGAAGVIVILALGYFLGVDVSPLLEGQLDVPGSGAPAEMTQADLAAGEFVAVTLADTEAIWSEVFADQLGGEYAAPVLVLYKGVTRSPCGAASGATGPFYCPGDSKIYLDTGFFTTLAERLGAGGDFAAAYVVAHEVAHHVQAELGILGEAQTLRARVSEARSNDISVRIELQADCFSGIWARLAEARLGTVEPGDLAEALNAARQIGDDTLQRNAGRAVQPHTFTHGSAAARSRWFQRGYETGAIAACDTMSADRL